MISIGGKGDDDVMTSKQLRLARTDAGNSQDVPQPKELQ